LAFENFLRLRSYRGLWRIFSKWLDFSFQLPELVIDLCDLTFLDAGVLIKFDEFHKTASKKETIEKVKDL
jgi:hypothetical protein